VIESGAIELWHQRSGSGGRLQINRKAF